jgi:hypothetical protein
MACWKLIAANDTMLIVEWAAVSSTLSTSREGEMASIRACDTLAPDFMLRVTPDQNLTLSDLVSRAQLKGGHVGRWGLMPCPIVR